MTLNDNVCMLLEKLRIYSPEMYEHSVNVAMIAESFAQRIGLNNKDIEKLKTASLLHDIGKLGIPKIVLNKPSRLTDEEYKIMMKHPQYGIDLLIKAGFFDKDILYLVLYHHERLDGLGYPMRLRNENISTLLRILSICDCYDAMRSKRSYKRVESLEYIKNEFLKNSGTQFDLKYVCLFLNFLNEQLAFQCSNQK